ncbi:MAG: hypothetical protein ACOC71_06910, partial [Hyphomicrobiales bacterium]
GGATPAEDDAKAAPKSPDQHANAASPAEVEAVAAEAPEAEGSRLGRAVRFVVGGVVRFATRS